MNRKIIRLAELVHEANEQTQYSFQLSFDATRFSLSVTAHHTPSHGIGTISLVDYAQFMDCGEKESALLDEAIRDVYGCIQNDLMRPTRIQLAQSMVENLESKGKPGMGKLVAHYLNLDYEVVGGMLDGHHKQIG